MLLDYGSTKLELQLPPGTPREILNSTHVEPLADPARAILDALHKPIGSLPLRDIVKPGEKVCLLVNDSTRVACSDLFLPFLIDELISAGIRVCDIFIVFANGSHRPLSESEMARLVGEKVAGTVAMYNHDSKDKEQLVYFGDTVFGTPVFINKRVAEADRRILTGSVVHHFFAGYGGGRKALVPGVAGWDTIQKNHSLMLDERARSGNLAGNPVHEDLLEAALMVGCDFIFNLVLNEYKNIIGLFAGDMEEAHREACLFADKVNSVRVKQPADLVIASCGGHPKDINLYQAHKALDNAFAALKPGGELIFLAKCPEGIGSDNYESWARRYRTLPELEAALKKEFVLGGHKAFKIARLLQKGTVYLLSDLSPAVSKMLGFTPISSLAEGLNLVFRKSDKLFTCVMPQGSLTFPRQ